MRVLRGLGGSLLWILASVLGLVGVLLCVTLLLLPVGLVVLRVARKLYTRSVALMLPPAVSHPVKESKRRLPRLSGRKAPAPVTALTGRKRRTPWGRTKKQAKKVLDRAS
jgi:hypothetical protein